MPPVSFSANVMPFVRPKKSLLNFHLCGSSCVRKDRHQFIRGNVAMGLVVWSTWSEEVSGRVLVQSTCDLLEAAELKEVRPIEDLKT